jgi:uncharacterized protein (DUF433 family)
LQWLASGMSPAEIVVDFPELNETHIKAALAFENTHTRKT